MLKRKEYRLFNGTKLIGSFVLDDELEIHLKDNLKLIEIPIDFTIGYKQGIKDFKGDIVMRWVKDRVIPSGRHNIESILKQVGIPEYDELAIFLFANGKYTQDFFRIESID